MIIFNKINTTNVFIKLLLLFVFTIPISSYVSIRLLVTLAVFSFFLKASLFRFFRQSWDIFIYLLVLLVGLIYSHDLGSGLKVLETNFSLLAIPIVFVQIYSFLEHDWHHTFYAFALGVLTASLICIGNASLRYYKGEDVSVFFFYQLTDITNAQPTYLAYYLILAITFGLYSLNYEKPLFHPLISFLLILFFFFVLLLTGGQTAFVSLLLVFSFFILKFFLGDRSGNQKLTIGLVIIMMASMFFVSSRQSAERENNLNDSWDRFALWRASIDANPNVIFGVGTGDSKIVLNEYFRQHNLSQYANESLNSHNQFIQIYLSNGLIGLLALLLMLLRPLYLSFKNNSSFGLLVFFPFLIYGMTEVFLGRYQGVVFFALLHQLFVSYYGSSNPAFNLKEA